MNHSRLQRRGFTFWEVVIVVGILAFLAAVLFPIFGRSRRNRDHCQSNLKQIGLGMAQYVVDYDGKYPRVASGAKANSRKGADLSAFGWADALYPYTKSTQLFQCPIEKTNSTKNEAAQSEYTDYWFNARASGVNEKYFSEPAQIILMGDGNDGTDATNARYHLMSIPVKWRSDEKSPLYRHRDEGGANFAFADGHVKWLKGSDWKNGLDFGGNTKATFRLKPAK